MIYLFYLSFFFHSVSLYKKAIHFEPLFLIYRPCYE
ncbi:pyridine nucleotide-disulfide oxidoreductase [Streptococcus mitis]|uniref:Pyridine nucleotide-disulfide oxidoreductase n=1 Tax=Streptococcus mitis TaxID=28037 RepID=A0A1T0CAJ2_STRMT|nr:pyridine nucleotide-disulfide oxidoreductase [Streptococcus mitis]MQQ50278.1 pyridine nucleotide-disulfide oxidoreductase [Streptococcus mitis]MQQ67321.1 pyridine nucleotide-disulfide oxidoreductase [Streptococcus mitis]OOS19377.1 pyridine nucleotide-disulfide oxidoreductase [Streptococcus mitis]ORO87170.1 pyridine nucleotide-disulfide oxidoreductase [Streptococcus mitis]